MDSNELRKCRFGFPKLERLSTIERAKKNADETLRITYKGESILVPVIKVRIQCPIYRLKNVRTITLQHEYIRKHEEAPKDLFSSDVDSIEAQMAQDEILQELVNEEGLLKEFKNDAQQTEAVICDSDGVIVNGNRRVCAWRKLYYENEDKYRHFETILVAVLPDNDETAIEDLEFDLQIRPEMKAEYHWHAVAEKMKEMLDQGLTPTKVGQKLGKTPQEVNNLTQAYDYARDYLAENGHPDEWSIVNKDEYAFTTAAKERRKLGDQGKRELFDELFKKALMSQDTEGRMYQVVKDIAQNIDEIADELETSLPEQQSGACSCEAQTTSENTENAGSSDSQVNDGFVDVNTVSAVAESEENDSKNGSNDVASIFLGGGDPKEDKYSKIAASVRSLDDKDESEGLLDTVQGVIQSTQEKERENSSSNYVKKQVQKAFTAMEEASSSIGPERDKSGIKENLNKIIEDVNKVLDWLDSE